MMFLHVRYLSRETKRVRFGCGQTCYSGFVACLTLTLEGTIT
jgi:hypothetical protein